MARRSPKCLQHRAEHLRINRTGNLDRRLTDPYSDRARIPPHFSSDGGEYGGERAPCMLESGAIADERDRQQWCGFDGKLRPLLAPPFEQHIGVDAVLARKL
ncbi:hypothetical protein [Pandoraea oxalativorans]|uniref:hypothetical protein n=1 Tax=Pandoraea oxalativorans TaxID=573737 RepID=UPI00147245E1|nr:hypothetical protein [Pandoraea oxalativorans]